MVKHITSVVLLYALVKVGASESASHNTTVNDTFDDLFERCFSKHVPDPISIEQLTSVKIPRSAACKLVRQYDNSSCLGTLLRASDFLKSHELDMAMQGFVTSYRDCLAQQTTILQDKRPTRVQVGVVAWHALEAICFIAKNKFLPATTVETFLSSLLSSPLPLTKTVRQQLGGGLQGAKLNLTQPGANTTVTISVPATHAAKARYTLGSIAFENGAFCDAEMWLHPLVTSMQFAALPSSLPKALLAEIQDAASLCHAVQLPFQPLLASATAARAMVLSRLLSSETQHQETACRFLDSVFYEHEYSSKSDDFQNMVYKLFHLSSSSGQDPVLTALTRRAHLSGSPNATVDCLHALYSINVTILWLTQPPSEIVSLMQYNLGSNKTDETTGKIQYYTLLIVAELLANEPQSPQMLLKHGLMDRCLHVLRRSPSNAAKRQALVVLGLIDTRSLRNEPYSLIDMTQIESALGNSAQNKIIAGTLKMLRKVHYVASLRKLSSFHGDLSGASLGGNSRSAYGGGKSLPIYWGDELYRHEEKDNTDFIGCVMAGGLVIMAILLMSHLQPRRKGSNRATVKSAFGGMRARIWAKVSAFRIQMLAVLFLKEKAAPIVVDGSNLSKAAAALAVGEEQAVWQGDDGTAGKNRNQGKKKSQGSEEKQPPAKKGKTRGKPGKGPRRDSSDDGSSTRGSIDEPSAVSSQSSIDELRAATSLSLPPQGLAALSEKPQEQHVAQPDCEIGDRQIDLRSEMRAETSFQTMGHFIPTEEQQREAIAGMSPEDASLVLALIGRPNVALAAPMNTEELQKAALAAMSPEDASTVLALIEQPNETLAAPVRKTPVILREERREQLVPGVKCAQAQAPVKEWEAKKRPKPKRNSHDKPNPKNKDQENAGGWMLLPKPRDISQLMTLQASPIPQGPAQKATKQQSQQSIFDCANLRESPQLSIPSGAIAVAKLETQLCQAAVPKGRASDASDMGSFVLRHTSTDSQGPSRELLLTAQWRMLIHRSTTVLYIRLLKDQKCSTTKYLHGTGKIIGHDVQAAADALVALVQPTAESDIARQRIVQQLADILELPLTIIGSTSTSTYLADSDIDTCCCCPTAEASVDLLMHAAETLQALEETESSSTRLNVHSVKIIDARVMIVKAVVDSFMVELVSNQANSLETTDFVNVVDLLTPQHLFKRSVLFIKAWLKYESQDQFGSCLLDSSAGGISAHGLQIMVLAIFNEHSHSISTPLDALMYFAVAYVNFDWENHFVSLQGPIDRGTSQFVHPVFPSLVPNELVHEYQMRIQSAGMPGPTCFKASTMNVIDPLCPSNNVGISVSPLSLSRFHIMLTSIHAYDWSSSAAAKELVTKQHIWAKLGALHKDHAFHSNAFPPLK